MIMINVQKMIKEERKKEANKRKDNLDLCVVELKKIVDKINDEILMAMIYNTYNVTTESVIIKNIVITEDEREELHKHIETADMYSCLADVIPIDDEYLGKYIKFKHERSMFLTAAINMSKGVGYHSVKFLVQGDKRKIKEIELILNTDKENFFSITLK